MTRFLHDHGHLLIGIFALASAVFLACVLGPTLDSESTLTADDGGRKTAYAAKD